MSPDSDEQRPALAPPRADGRAANELRPVRFDTGVQRHPPGSALVAYGATEVICSASWTQGAPRWRGHRGWVTGEYAMLPGATSDRAGRERNGPGGRSKEIERLLGRSLRSVVNLDALPDGTLTLDADVLNADGGTRTAAITGGWVAMVAALRALELTHVVSGQVAAVSVGIVDGEPRLDLPYEEDVRAEVDMNVVMTADGRFVEVQGTAEAAPFDRAQLDRLLELAEHGCRQLFDQQTAALRGERA